MLEDEAEWLFCQERLPSPGLVRWSCLNLRL